MWSRRLFAHKVDNSFAFGIIFNYDKIFLGVFSAL